MQISLSRLPIAALVAVAIVSAVEVAAFVAGAPSPVATRLADRASRVWEKAANGVLNRGRDSTKQITAKGTEVAATKKPNPFVMAPDKQTFLPFIGFGSVVSKHPVQLDYFGFRNHLGDQIYVQRKRPLIVMTGNSELAGWRHETDIAALLQAELRIRNLNFDVLNLAVNSYSLAAEIGSYVHFADKLCPSLVIAHSGGIEYQYGMVVPFEFRRLGLAYHPPLEEWAYRLHSLRDYDGPPIWRQRDPNARLEQTVAATGMILQQYRSLVERNGRARFLFGAQKMGQQHDLFPFWNKRTRDDFMSRLRNVLIQSRIDFIWFDDDDKVVLVDPIHSTQESAQHIAMRYADWIESRRHQLRTDISALEGCLPTTGDVKR